uniref:Aminotransferase-like plant mobile domain-containing protein n=1 Tax=Fagus sylvatica TaxID=28930 RepID=A0A2N9J4U5_FAGSY
MASSSGDPDSLVVLHFHNFCAERMRHWWNLLGGNDHASIKGVFGKEMDLVPTLEEYAELLQLGSPFSEMPIIPTQGPRSNRVLEKYLGLTSGPTSWGILLQASRIGESFGPTPSRSPLQGEGVPMFCTQLLQLWFYSHLRHFYLLQTPYHFTRHTVRQTVDTVLPFTDNSHDWALYLLNLSLSYYPSLALRQFGGLQYPPRLGDLSSVTFDYVPGNGLPVDSSVTAEFAEWREGWSSSFTPRPTVRLLTWRRELGEARAELVALRLARISEREESAARVESMRRTLHTVMRQRSRSLGGAKDHLEQALADAQGQLEAEQVERTRVQDELDSLHFYTQALIDPSTGRPQIVDLRWALDESEATLIVARTSMGAMRVQIIILQGDENMVLLTEATRVVESLGAEARTVLEEYEEGDPILSTALGRFCMETYIRLGHS